MAEQVLIQFRADKALKEEVAEIYKKLGLDLSTALRMFLRQSSIDRGLPFEAKLDKKEKARIELREAFYRLRAQAADLPEMSLDEINELIAETRAERRARGENDLRRY